jgi:hypothetical protein
LRQAERLVEKRLNRILRRVDWRFLLPNPWPKKIAVAVRGLLLDSVPLLGGDVIELQSGLPGESDLVVLQNPDRRQLRAAWGALTPGGALYAEWKLPPAGGPPVVRGDRKRPAFRWLR